MKKILSLIILQCVVSFSMAQNNDLSFSGLDKSPLDVVIARDTANKALSRIIYSRPAMRDRDIFGALVPFGTVWRTGANEATEITFYKDVVIGNQEVNSGTYSIYTVPNEEEWTFILNSETTQWGTDYDPTKNILEMSVQPMLSPTSIEHFSISFLEQEQGLILFMGWDDTIVQVPIKFARAG